MALNLVDCALCIGKLLVKKKREAQIKASATPRTIMKKRKTFLYLLILTVFLILPVISYWLFGHRLLEAIYEGKSIDFVNKNFMKNKAVLSLDILTEYADKLFIYYIFFVCLFLLFIYSMIFNYPSIKAVAFLSYLLFGLLILLYGLLRPFHNWDLIPYVACAKSLEASDAKEIHRFAFGEMKKSVSNKTYMLLTEAKGESYSEYRKAMSIDADAFVRQLSLYKFRIIYTGLVFILYRIGMNIVFATHLISAVSVFFGILLLYVLSMDYLKRPFVYLLPPMAVLVGLSDLARLSTPDGLAFLAIVTATYLLLKNRQELLIILPVIVAIRNEFIIFCFPLLVYLLIFSDFPKPLTIISICISFCIFWFLKWFFQHPGWEAYIYLGSRQLWDLPLTSTISISFSDYMRVFYRNINIMLSIFIFKKEIVIYIFTSVLLLALIMVKVAKYKIKYLMQSKIIILGILALVFMPMLLTIFPHYEKRFYVATNIILLFSALALYSESWREHRFSKIEEMRGAGL